MLYQFSKDIAMNVSQYLEGEGEDVLLLMRWTLVSIYVLDTWSIGGDGYSQYLHISYFLNRSDQRASEFNFFSIFTNDFLLDD
jgi:hypothetical protein